MLDKAAPAHTIFASNTSSLPIADIAKATSRQDRYDSVFIWPESERDIQRLLENVELVAK